jgi:hypothetical protein
MRERVQSARAVKGDDRHSIDDLETDFRLMLNDHFCAHAFSVHIGRLNDDCDMLATSDPFAERRGVRCYRLTFRRNLIRHSAWAAST